MSVSSPKSSLSGTESKKSPSSSWWLLTAAIPIVVAIGISIPLAMKQHAQEGFFGMRMFPLKAAYDFKLSGPNSAEFRLDQFRGKAVLFIFGFTHCANICPTSLTNLASVYQALTPAEQKQVQILFISVDPKRDTPQMLQRYVTSFDPTFVGLTGSKAAIDQTVRAYGASYEVVAGSTNQPNDYSVNHSAYVYLVNPSGMWELLYDNEKLADIQRMLGDIRAVLQERAPR
jgi:protein SCO1/2